jgi:hypothetical protein
LWGCLCLMQQVEQITKLKSFAMAGVTYYQSCAAVLEALVESLNDIAGSVEHVPKRAVRPVAAGLYRIITHTTFNSISAF